MRTRKSFYNMAGVLALYLIKIFFSFAGKTCLIHVMGDEYNGINALFNSIISMLSIAEFGIGSAIIYNLYKPVKENNIEEIKAIMMFYKKCYAAIGGIVFILGLCISPFIKNLVGNISISDNIYILFYLYLFDAVTSYLLTYKRSILYAYQKNYVISACDIAYTVTLQVLQILSLILTHNFIFFLLTGVVCRVVENMVIQWVANKKYPFLKDKSINKLSVQVRNDIVEKVKGLIFHKIGSYIVFGTDNIIISRMVNIVAEGMYSNYLTIINPLSNIIAQTISALQASVGNLLIDENKQKNYIVYKKIALLNCWLYTVASICFLFLIQDFISLWIGQNRLFSNGVVFILAINFWQTGMRGALGIFKNAAGIYYEDRYIPLIESLINLIVSIILTKLYGLIGVFIGTFVSSLVIFLYSFPILVYKPLFGKNYKMYALEMCKYVGEWILCFGFSFIVEYGISKLNVVNGYLSFIVKAFLVFFICNLMLLLINYKKEEFTYYKNLIINKLKK